VATGKTSTDRKQQVVAEFRRSEILAAAGKVFASKGLESTRMEDIAKVARLAKGTLYLYFASKDAIYEAVVQQALGKLAALTAEHVDRETSFAGKIAAFVSVRNAFWSEHQQLYRIILSIKRDGLNRKRSIAWQKEAVSYLAILFVDAAKAGEIPEQDFVAAAWTTMDALRGVNERRAFAEGRATDDDARFLTEFLLRALGTRSKHSS
jgi:AcrR family transcriptional regulator